MPSRGIGEQQKTRVVVVAAAAAADDDETAIRINCLRRHHHVHVSFVRLDALPCDVASP